MGISTFVKSLANILTTKGDLLVFGTTESRLAVGTDNQVLTADSGESLGVKWADSSGTTLTTQTDVQTATETTTTTSGFATSTLSITLANRSGGFVLINAGVTVSNDANGSPSSIALFDDGVVINDTLRGYTTPTANYRSVMSTSWAMALNGSVINLRFRSVNASTTSLHRTTSSATGQISENGSMQVLEVGGT